MFTITITGDGLRRFDEAVKVLGSEAKAKRALSMALNKVARTVNAKVKRSVASQMGTTQKNVVKHGNLKVRKSSASTLTASIDTHGGYMPLKDFNPRQGRKGVRAGAWGNRRLHAGTWINRGSAALIGIGPIGRAVAGGHVFKNTGKFNKRSGRKNAIKALWGPAVPREIVIDDSKKTFESVSAQRLPLEIDRAVRALTKGVVT